MINVVMLVKGRPTLSLHAWKSLTKNTISNFNLTVVDDGSDLPISCMALTSVSGDAGVIRIGRES